jgi:dynein heavy chain
LFAAQKLSKESQIKALTKLNSDWANLKKMSKDVKKEIAPLVAGEMDLNNFNIKKLEEDITLFTQEMRKREFFNYKCGTSLALEKLDGVFVELKVFEEKIADYGDNARKFGNPDLIQKAIKDIETIKVSVDNMKVLWDHIDVCQKTFSKFLTTKWDDTQPFEMEDVAKSLFKTLKDMKVDKKASAYTGILDEIKVWLVFLPLIAELADPAMRDRHWDSIKKKVGVNFVRDSNLLLKHIYDLGLG